MHMTRPTSTWKNFERRVAAALGGQRIPASGNGAIKGDVRHDLLLIECKYGAQVPKKLHDWMAEAVRDAATETKNRGADTPLVPMLVVGQPRAEALVIVRLKDFEAVEGEC